MPLSHQLTIQPFEFDTDGYAELYPAAKVLVLRKYGTLRRHCDFDVEEATAAANTFIRQLLSW